MNISSDRGFPLPASIRGFSLQEVQNPNPKPNANLAVAKKRRNLPGTPDPDAEVIALSPKTLMEKNRFMCEICNKGFQRDQNLQLHRRAHNLPWKLRQRTNKVVKKKVYLCPEKTCVHHDRSRALGDLTGIKKHYSRKHGEKKWKCEKCSKKYAVQSDWKAHTKSCGTKEYKCDCGTLFSRKDSFITHRAFCDALAEESARLTSAVAPSSLNFWRDPITRRTIDSQPDFPHGFVARGHGIPDPAGISQFSSAFWPDLNSMAAGNPLGASLSEMVQMESGNLFGSSLMPRFEINHQFPLLDRSATSSNGPDAFSLSTLPPTILKQEAGGNNSNKTNLVETPGSLYSSDHQHDQNNRSLNPTAPMSAMALLQKAAQLGCAGSSNPSIFGTSFGTMTTFSSSNNNSQSTHFCRNELQDIMEAPKQVDNLRANSRLVDCRIGGSGLGSTATTPVNELDQLMTMRTAVNLPNDPSQLKPHQSLNQADNGLTRDFLGMGGDHGGHPFLPSELNGLGYGFEPFH
ncbi:hypothetical protein Nepgr_011924 [Nepenthes gracilis]|uniref:C2H2-type domain-containing protein n=1 Tax=Nepenthes gracilis TaxID=150966 RepID=A0AAD3SF31_NEPGR|nr:hypothetical protein Nepgr_011924 [Nepenthes gracilis]